MCESISRDDFKKELMPNLKTNPEEYPEYFYSTVAIRVGIQIVRAREEVNVTREELTAQLKKYFPSIKEKDVRYIEMGVGMPDFKIVQMCALILKKDINVTLSSKA